MRKLKSISAFLLFFSLISCNAQSEDSKSIKQLVINFAQAGDQQNATQLNNYLDDNYRIIMNQLFGSETISLMNKVSYLEKIKSKEFGGDNRKVTIDHLIVNGKNASAEVTMVGAKSTFISLMIFVKDKNNSWKIISDVPTVK